jgi:hypothetical protein
MFYVQDHGQGAFAISRDPIGGGVGAGITLGDPYPTHLPKKDHAPGGRGGVHGIMGSRDIARPPKGFCIHQSKAK